jgi:cytochrome b561
MYQSKSQSKSQPLPIRTEETSQYDRVQRTFHWTMAGIILLAMLLGLWASFLKPGTPLRVNLLEVHKSLGITAFLLALPRIAYRWLAKAPNKDGETGLLTRAAARSAHLSLYVMMLFMPLTGYVFSAAGGYSLPWFGLFHWPRLLAKDRSVSEAGEMLHDKGAWIIYAIVAVHLAAVAWHHFYRKDNVLSRMLPGPRDGTGP